MKFAGKLVGSGHDYINSINQTEYCMLSQIQSSFSLEVLKKQDEKGGGPHVT